MNTENTRESVLSTLNALAPINSTPKSASAPAGEAQTKIAEKLMSGAQFVGVLGFQFALALAQGKSVKIGGRDLSLASISKGEWACPTCPGIFHGKQVLDAGLSSDSDKTHFARLFGKSTLFLSADGKPFLVSDSCLFGQLKREQGKAPVRVSASGYFRPFLSKLANLPDFVQATGFKVSK